MQRQVDGWIGIWTLTNMLTGRQSEIHTTIYKTVELFGQPRTSTTI